MSELFKRTHLCGNLNIKNVEEEVVLNGWVAKQRSLGGLIFVDLRDKTGIVQITFDDTIPKRSLTRQKPCEVNTSSELRGSSKKEQQRIPISLLEKLKSLPKNWFSIQNPKPRRSISRTTTMWTTT